MKNRRHSSFILLHSSFFLLLLLASTALAAPPPVRIAGVPHIVQKPDFCGEACVAMWMSKLGYTVDQDWVYDQSGLNAAKNPRHARGCYTPDLYRAMKAIGFTPGQVWFKVDAKKPAKEVGALFDAMVADLRKGVPSAVCMRYSDRPKTTEHIRLVLGYDPAKDEVIYHEPAEKDGAYRRMNKALFLKLWPLKYGATQWTVIRLRLAGKGLKKGEVSKAFTGADYAQEVMKLKEKAPKGFRIRVEPPFVVTGDGSEAAVRGGAKTVAWTVRHIKKLYFEKDPDTIIDVWLFKDKASYNKHTWSLFKDKPTTPYGYYSSRHNALIMNISTGGGTLVHEIVHPFMHANFPQCPAWFNKGLASLYEQCGTKDGSIYGYTNWRLAGLQKAVRAKRVPAFKKLCSTTQHQFYSMDKGTNYAQARYLCYYLQRKGLLTKFYHAFHKSQRTDPSGYKTLVNILGEKEAGMTTWQKGWEKWVSRLRYPEGVGR